MKLHTIRRISFFSALSLLIAFPIGAQQRQTILGRKETEKKLPAKKEAPKDTLLTTPTKTGLAEINGLLVDSLHGTYLRNAEVIVDGAQRTTTSDSVGRFTVSGLKPGTYQIGVFHPVLDSLGLSLATKKFYVGADSSSFVTLSVPSATTIIRTSCPPPGPRAQGTSAVIGRVTDPESMLPVKGAEVSIAWTQLEVSKEIGVRRTPRLLRDSTNALGDYRICGLPADMKATLQARMGMSVTAEVPIELGTDDELFLRNLLLSRVDSGAKTGNAVVSGTVLLEGAPSNAGSRVELVGTNIVAMTNDKGQFTMRNLPSGSHVLLARHLGFGAETVPVDLTSREAKQVTVKLPKFVATIEPVVVTAKRAASLDKVGFTSRQRSGMGFYLGPDQIARMAPNYLTDILRTVPGLQVSYGPQGEQVTSTRGVTSLSGAPPCVQYYVDDMPWQSLMPGDVNQFVNGREVVGIEVYNGPGTPPQYTRGGQGDCTTIVVWTKFKIRS